MSEPIRFSLVLHNHQPVGNFGDVIETAYQDSYLPFLDLFESYENLPIALHTSGPLMEWLDQNHPDYLDRLAALVSAGRIEIVGGGYYEPILTMIPSCDRVGQISTYTRWLEARLGARVKGMWIAERVWEQSCVRDIVDAGIDYTIIDDFHFKTTGLNDDDLHGYFITEDEGRVLSVFPGSEHLRYIIPFGSPSETIDHLRSIAEKQPGAVVVFGDDGEKFGSWPDTKKHVYEDGWLRQFFDALSANRDWIQMTTPAEIIKNVLPHGKIYLPDASYREMTEWSLPAERIIQYEQARHDLADDPRWPRIAPFVRGGFWRNFKVKYPESNEMYTRMLAISGRLDEAIRQGTTSELLDHAQTELYRGQCNCAYWHGAFGGIYLPHLRGAIYNHLIAADNLLDQATGRGKSWVEAKAEDFNLDARQEVLLSNHQLSALIAPARGGQIYELDVRSICHNLMATLTRRPEAYHSRVLAGESDGGGVSSIHDRVVFKQKDLDKRIQYDAHPRNSLLDHFFDEDANLDTVASKGVASGEATEHANFIDQNYETRLRRNPGRVQVHMTGKSEVFGVPLSITKGITLEAESNQLEIAYLIEGLPPDRTFHFGVEFNIAGMPGGADDRFFFGADHNRIDHLGARLDLHELDQLGLYDEWLGMDVVLAANRSTDFWTYPVESVSQSEGGFELVQQSVCVIPHWIISGDSDGRWSVEMKFRADTSLAESRMRPEVASASV